MKQFLKWRIIYAVCCLAYAGWMIYLGGDEFDKINGHHRLVVSQLDAGRIRTAALEELIAKCRRESTVRADRQEDACLSWTPSVVESRGKKIEERLIRAKKGADRRLVLFYTGFVVFFLFTPPFLMYLFIVALVKVYSNVKIVR